MNSREQRSYLGIGAWLLWLIASLGIGFTIVEANFAGYKLVGIEIVIVGPFALLLYLWGFEMGAAGRRNRLHNPLSSLGTILNLSALLLIAGLLAWPVLVEIFHRLADFFVWGAG